MAKFGVVVPDWMEAQIEAPLEYGDSRSARIRELVSLALAVEDALADNGVATDGPEEREQAVREAINSYYES